jgi:outer membrane protein assembly factor BamB
MYLGNPAHTGNQDAVGPESEPERLWRVKTGVRPRSAPAVAAGTVYVGGDAGLHALDAATGNQRWLFETEEEISASPAVIEGVVYVGSADGAFYAIDAGTGIERWRFETGGKIRSSAVIVDGVIYFTSFDGYIYALDIASGAELWRYETELDDLTSSPAVANGVLYFGGGRIEGGSVYALDLSTRESYWKDPVRVAGAVGSSPMVLDGFVYVGSDVGSLYGIDAKSGEVVCEFPTGRLVRSSPSTYNGMILIGNRKQSLFALAGGGNCDTPVWEVRVRDWVDSPPTVAGDTIYFGSLDNNLYALDATTQEIRWSHQTGGGILTSPAVVDGVVYFTSRDGYVYALGES